jgi:hypothetical protein
MKSNYILCVDVNYSENYTLCKFCDCVFEKSYSFLDHWIECSFLTVYQASLLNIPFLTENSINNRNHNSIKNPGNNNIQSSRTNGFSSIINSPSSSLLESPNNYNKLILSQLYDSFLMILVFFFYFYFYFCLKKLFI